MRTAKSSEKKCEKCSKEFSPDKLHPYQRFCSKECRYQQKLESIRVKEKMVRYCKVCMKPFNPRGPQKTCSKICRKKNHKFYSEKWNKAHFNDPIHIERKKNYSRMKWKELKEKQGIGNRRFIQQYLLVKKITQLLGAVEVKEEHSFSWLKGDYNKPLKVDAFFPEFNLVVEYDGEQHFMPIRWGGVSKERAYHLFLRQKRRDEIKNRLIKENGLRLLRIKYNESFSEQHILKRLIELGVYIPSTNIIDQSLTVNEPYRHLVMFEN